MSTLVPEDDVTVLELLDRVVAMGVHISGDLLITLADVDLLYIKLQAVVASAARLKGGDPFGRTAR